MICVMSNVAFDTLKLAQSLCEKGGLSANQAEATAEALSQAFSEGLGGEVRTPKHDMTGVKSELTLIKWMIGFVLAFQVGIFAKTFMH